MYSQNSNKQRNNTVPNRPSVFSLSRFVSPLFIATIERQEGSSNHELYPSNYKFSASAKFIGQCLNKTYAFSFQQRALVLKVRKKYKPAAQRVHPVSTTLPEEYRVIRKLPSDPLANMVPLPVVPPEPTPGQRYTQERMDIWDLNPDGFLWPEEVKLVQWLIKTHERAFAWEESEKGAFREDYFAPLKIPVVPHEPWAERPIPIPPGIAKEVTRIFQDKVNSKVYEPSSSPYRSRILYVPKKSGAIRIVHDLRRLNAVTIKDSALPPVVELYAEAFGGRTIYAMFDLFVGFDHRHLHQDSRDYTTFSSPIGNLRLTRLPQGFTNSVQVQQGDVSFILQPEIPEYTAPFVDDVPVKGPQSYYKDDQGNFETIAGNSGIRRFVWEHLTNVHRIIQRIEHAGGTFNAGKSFLAVPEINVVGHICSVKGRTADESKIQVIRNWPPCKDLTDVRSFLGTLGVMRIFIKDYALHSRPLTELTKKLVDFHFGKEEQQAMDELKELLINSPALRSLDYESDGQIILEVDSSNIATGFILAQVKEDGKEHPSRFGSITWNERESRYSQAKIELYGLFRSLRAYRIYLIGVQNLVVRTDASYLKGMLNNPDVQPNATINRWIAAILLFSFTLEHVPGKFHSPDGLSRRKRGENDPPEEPAEDVEDWIDRACGFGVWVMNNEEVRSQKAMMWRAETSKITGSVYQVLANVSPARVNMATSTLPEAPHMPTTEKTKSLDEELDHIKQFLSDPVRPTRIIKQKDYQRFLKKVSRYFLLDGKMWLRVENGQHRQVLPREDRLRIMREIHDKLGHKSYFTAWNRITTRFWWPSINQDIRWYLMSCPECQAQSTKKIIIPPTVSRPLSLFAKVYADTFFMPKGAGGKTYALHLRCSLSGMPEGKAVAKENHTTIGDFLMEVMWRWGAIAVIVTDNGAPWIKAVEYLAEKYGIHHIAISGYNSKANGIIERRHYDVREAIVKTCDGDISRWPIVFPYVLWAERVTIQKSTGYCPYYIAHGLEPLFPFDIQESTFMYPDQGDILSDEELLARRAIMLQKRPEDLEKIKDKIYNARLKQAKYFEEYNAHRIFRGTHLPGSLVLVRNSPIEKSLNRKTKPRYFGPIMVLRQTKGGSYICAELNGAVSFKRYAAFRLIPYVARDPVKIPWELLSIPRERVDEMADEEVPEDFEVETDEY